MVSISILSAVDTMTILYSTIALAGLALVFAVVLAVLGKKLAVKENEKVKEVRSRLSGANCGACGYAGCDAFAKAVVEGGADINDCSATAVEKRKEIAEILGVEVNAVPTRVVVKCCGGNQAEDKYEYMGYGNCQSMVLLAGGRKKCAWGCVGTGSCTDICPTHAITVGENGYAVVDDELCINCGKCISACPKSIVARIPESAKVYVACSNHQKGKEVKDICKSGCIACGMCARNCPEKAITIVDNLAVIDYDKCTNCGLCASKCPTKCIKILD